MTRLIQGALSVLAVVAAGCVSLSKSTATPAQTRFQTPQEAGTVQVAIQSIAPFEEYVDVLQPRFTITPEAALESAIADAQVAELRSLRLALAQVTLALPTSTSTRTQTTNTKDGVAETTLNETRAASPAASPAPQPPGALTATVTPFDLASRATVLDPSLKYRAAAALFQEIALLSSYVRDAAVRSSSVPYVVRILVSVFPSARREPYDIYTAVSFFAEDLTPIIYGRGDIETLEVRYRDASLRSALTLLAKTSDCEGQPVEVVPLFVTDNVESSILTSGRDEVRDTTAGLGGVVSNFGIGVSGRRAAQDASRTLGRDLNSLFTLGRASANTLEARLGAFRVEGTFHTVPRTYNLTALVLMPAITVPKATSASFEGDLMVPCRSVRFAAYSQFRDAETGVPLARPGEIWLREQVGAIATESGLALNDLSSATTAVLEGDFKGFESLSTARDTNALARRAWPELMALARRTGKSYGAFDVPPGRFHFFSYPREDDPRFPLLDNGDTAELAISGASGLRAEGLAGSLIVLRPGTNEYVVIEGTAAKVSDDGRLARFTFPSPKKTFGQDVAMVAVELAYRGPVQRWKPEGLGTVWRQSQTPVIQVKAAAAKPDPRFAISLSSNVIAADSNGSGEVRLEVRATGKPAPKVRLSTDGGHIASAIPALGAEGPAHVADSDRTYVIALRGLVPGSSLRVRAWRLEGEERVAAPEATALIVARPEPKPPTQ